MKKLRRFFHRLSIDLRQAGSNAFRHSVFQNSKAAAYSGILSLFPTLLAFTTVLALAPEGSSFLGELRYGFSQILPPDTMLLVQAYFNPDHGRSLHLIIIACSISFFAAMGLMLALMEGLRRADRLPRSAWNFWKQRLVAILLIPGMLIPMFFATALITFGHAIEQWMIIEAGHSLRLYVLLFWRAIRWSIALFTSVVVLATVYHFGIPRRRHWRHALPGAFLSTATWFAATLLFGWYVTRFSHYQIVYGSLGAGMATLVWLYIVSLSILYGAEFNAQVYRLDRPEPIDPDTLLHTAHPPRSAAKRHSNPSNTAAKLKVPTANAPHHRDEHPALPLK
jgi:membrane protein